MLVEIGAHFSADGEPGGTGSPMDAISARFAPLPPSNSRIFAFPSVLVPNSKTNLLCFTWVFFLLVTGAIVFFLHSN